MRIDNIDFIIHYYLSTCFGFFCDPHQGVTQEYKKKIHAIPKLYN